MYVTVLHGFYRVNIMNLHQLNSGFEVAIATVWRKCLTVQNFVKSGVNMQ